MSFLLWILAISAVLLLLRLVLGTLTANRAFKTLFLPGVLAAAAGKLLACALTKTRIQEVNLPWREGEPVKHEEPKVPIWGPLCVALVPVLVGAIGVVIARNMLVPDFIGRIELPELEAHPSAITVFLDTCRQVLAELKAVALAGEFRRWQMALCIYLSMSFLSCTAPTWKEWSRIKGLIFVCILCIGVVAWLGLEAGLFTRGWYISYAWSGPVFEGLALILMASLFSLGAMAAGRWTVLVLLGILQPKKKESKK